MPNLDPAESLDRPALARHQRDALDRVLRAILASNRFYQPRLAAARAAGFDAARDSVDRLPFTTRVEIEADQLAHPPYGANLTFPLSAYTRLHQTSGSSGTPLRWLDTPESWAWWKGCWSIVYRAAGVTPADRIAFCFSFGPFIGFWSAFEAAGDLGNLCLTAGGMSSVARLRFMAENGATVLCCTPTYALRLAEAAAEENIDIAGGPVRLVIVAGEPGGSIPATRASIEQAWGARVIDHAGMTEVGAWGFEPVETPGQMRIIESEFIAEVIDPATLRPVPDGALGELVLTNLGRIGSPLIRYRTGDLVRLTRRCTAAGRHFAALEGGVLGRVDDMLIIRGNNVFPSAIEGILRGLGGVAEFRLSRVPAGAIYDLRIEVEPAADVVIDGLANRVANAVRDRLNFRPTVEVVARGTLPRFEMKSRRK